jgi:hypothetical protein
MSSIKIGYVHANRAADLYLRNLSRWMPARAPQGRLLTGLTAEFENPMPNKKRGAFRRRAIIKTYRLVTTDRLIKQAPCIS